MLIKINHCFVPSYVMCFPNIYDLFMTMPKMKNSQIIIYHLPLSQDRPLELFATAENCIQLYVHILLLHIRPVARVSSYYWGVHAFENGVHFLEKGVHVYE